MTTNNKPTQLSMEDMQPEVQSPDQDVPALAQPDVVNTQVEVPAPAQPVDEKQDLPRIMCRDCGYSFIDVSKECRKKDDVPQCPLCSGKWDVWELRLSPIPLEKNRAQIASWLGQLPFPSAIDIKATDAGIRIRMFTPPGVASGAVKSWASMTHQQTRWARIKADQIEKATARYFLNNNSRVHTVSLSDRGGDPILALSGYLLNHHTNEDNGIRVWLTGKDPELQARLQALVSYSYGTESGVGDNTPNPWGIRLTSLRIFVALGIILSAVFTGSAVAGWINMAVGIIGMIAGGILALVATFGIIDWMSWRSIPKNILESKTEDVLLKTSIIYYGNQRPADLSILTGDNSWTAISEEMKEWPFIRSCTLTLSGGDLATIVSPPETGETSGVMARDTVQEIPAPPPSTPLIEAPFKVGESVAGDERIGIDPDAHGVASGGSRSGKTSIAYSILTQLIEKGEDAPGMFLVDPHLSLADGVLQFIHDLPAEKRAVAIKRLRIISPDQPMVVPLNLLTLPDYSWAGNALIQIGQRIWDDYWGPRMQAALLGLFRIAHAWNQYEKNKMGLLHVVFSAFNTTWRHAAMGFVDTKDRLGILALDALLGQFGEENSKNQSWVTEVVSPILSKVMALELSPWLFSALHQNRFVDFEKWIDEKAWVIMRLPTGEIGRESARLIASVVYNVFDAAFRKATAKSPIPYYFVIDETQEIGTGMRLENMLAEGAKFGARMFILTQSLAMMRKAENMEALVQSILANTSTQAFFSPDPEDADTIRAILNSTHRYGDITLDIPTLTCWLRARVNRHWQPPTLVNIKPVGAFKHDDVKEVINEVLEAHAEDYVRMEDWEAGAMHAVKKMLPTTAQGLLSELFGAEGARDAMEKIDDKNDRAAEEEMIRQEKIQKKVKEAEEKGEEFDPASVDDASLQPEPIPEPIDADDARVGF